MREDSYHWTGDGEAAKAAGYSGGHVGGLSAAIAYGWSTAVETHVTVYSDTPFPLLDGKEAPIYAAGTWIKRGTLSHPLKPDAGVSLRRDGSGKAAPTSDPIRALIECCLDEGLYHPDLVEILRSAKSEGVDRDALLAEAALHGPEVEAVVRDRVRAHFR